MSDEQIPAWLNGRLYTLKKQGRLLLTSEPKLDFSALSSPAAYRQLCLMKVLDVSRNDITSIEGLRRFPKLTHFIANTTKIDNLRNFKVLEGVTTVSLENTPIAENENFRLALAIVVGASLKSINGKMITSSLARKAQSYPDVCRDLVNCGWMPECPCPDDEQLAELCTQYQVNKEESSSTATEIRSDDAEESGEDEGGDEAPFQERLARLRRAHELMIEKGEALFGIITASDEDQCKAVSDVLRAHGFDVDETNDAQILEAVKKLCSEM